MAVFQVHEQLRPFHPVTGLDYGAPAWRVADERRSLDRAIQAADACEGRAVVTLRDDSVELHANGKEPLRVEYDFGTGKPKGLYD